MTTEMFPEFKVHELRIDPEHYNDTESGLKRSTVRLGDRLFNEGDYIVLRKTKYTGKQMAGVGVYPLVYTGQALMCKITHIYSGIGMAEGYVVLSFTIIDRWPGSIRNRSKSGE